MASTIVSSGTAAAGFWTSRRRTAAGLQPLRKDQWFHDYAVPGLLLDSAGISLRLMRAVHGNEQEFALEPDRRIIGIVGNDGSVVVLEVDEHDHLSAFAAIEGSVGGVIGPDDIEHAAESIAEGSSLLLIVWEDLWAAPFGDALRRAGGVFLEGGRIPAEIAEEVIQPGETGQDDDRNRPGLRRRA